MRSVPVKPHCTWVQDSDGIWNTDCEHSFVINNEDTPLENGMVFCCYCGSPLAEMEYTEEDEDG